MYQRNPKLTTRAGLRGGGGLGEASGAGGATYGKYNWFIHICESEPFFQLNSYLEKMREKEFLFLKFYRSLYSVDKVL